MNFSSPGSSVHGILQARILEWVAISFFRGSSQPDPGIELPGLLHCRQILYCPSHLEVVSSGPKFYRGRRTTWRHRRKTVTSRGERPQNRQILPTPASQTSGFQKCKNINFCCLSPLWVMLCQDSPGWLIQGYVMLSPFHRCEKLRITVTF